MFIILKKKIARIIFVVQHTQYNNIYTVYFKTVD